MTAEDAIEPAPTTETWLRGVIRNAGAVIVCTDADCRITEFNPAAERAFGRRRGEVIGLRYSELFPPIVRSKVDQDCGRVLGGEPIDQFENTISDPDGHLSVLLWDVRRLVDPSGRAEGIVGIAQDITARLGTEASLERRKREMRTLMSLHRAMIATSEPGALAAAALSHLAQLVDCADAAVYAVAGSDAVQVLATIGAPPASPPSTHAADLAEDGEILLPLVSGGEHAGLLYVRFARGQELSASQLAGIAAQIADRLAAALHVART